MDNTSILENAIREYIKVEGYPSGLITGWTVLVTTMNHDGPEEKSGLLIFYPGGETHWHIAFGILELAKQKLIVSFQGRFASDE